ncbi:MAG: DnaJ domain-containing protein [Spirochaetia bacterium]|jgi:hypothetical protein|nr:DnaJ domain-containing protein [Spirochaetia bacterium]
MSIVDQLFDRFGDLLKSWTIPAQPYAGPFSDPARGQRFGDPDLDDAMAELDAYLDDDKAAEERLRRQREAREEAERQRTNSRPASGGARPASGPPAKLLKAYKTLGLAYGSPFEQAKANYKRLLKEHHPDKHGSTPEAQKRATETSARINDAFRIIETWHDTGTLGDE